MIDLHLQKKLLRHLQIEPKVTGNKAHRLYKQKVANRLRRQNKIQTKGDLICHDALHRYHK